MEETGGFALVFTEFFHTDPTRQTPTLQERF